MLRKFVALLLLTAFCRANPLDSDLASIVDDAPDIDSEDGEGRIFFSSNGGISLTNSTVNLASLLTAGLLALLFAIVFGAALALKKGGNQSSGYGYGQQQGGYGGGGGQGGYGQQNFYARSDVGSDNDLASQMYQLAMAFKKYEVKDLECQLFVACEASQVRKEAVESGSVLAEIAEGVRPIMRNIGRHGRKAIQQKDDYVAKLVDAYMYGDEIARGGRKKSAEAVDACAEFKSKCYDNSKKSTSSSSA